MFKPTWLISFSTLKPKYLITPAPITCIIFVLALPDFNTKYVTYVSTKNSNVSNFSIYITDFMN